MDYLLANALEILYLALALGFLLLVFFTIRLLVKVTWTVNRVNAWIEIFEELVQKPVQILWKIHKTLQPVLKLFGKNKR